MLVSSFVLVMTRNPYYLTPTIWSSIWLFPFFLAHLIRHERTLFCTAISVHVVMSAIDALALEITRRPATYLESYIGAAAGYASYALSAPVQWIPFIGIRGEVLLWSVVCAPLYGLVGVFYARACRTIPLPAENGI